MMKVRMPFKVILTDGAQLEGFLRLPDVCMIERRFNISHIAFWAEFRNDWVLFGAFNALKREGRIKADLLHDDWLLTVEGLDVGQEEEDEGKATTASDSPESSPPSA